MEYFSMIRAYTFCVYLIYPLIHTPQGHVVYSITENLLHLSRYQTNDRFRKRQVVSVISFQSFLFTFKLSMVFNTSTAPILKSYRLYISDIFMLFLKKQTSFYCSAAGNQGRDLFHRSNPFLYINKRFMVVERI